MAKALQKGEKDIGSYLTELNRNLLGDAKRKVDQTLQEIGRDAARNANNPTLKQRRPRNGSKGGKASSKGGIDGKGGQTKRPWVPSKFAYSNRQSAGARPTWEREGTSGSGKGNAAKRHRGW